MLPMEAIELDAFRRRHEFDTFWCGVLLGGCGAQLTTKLYTDRVCHFAHHPGADGEPHMCGRASRGVSSADHLYVKAAAASWLRGRGTEAEIVFARPAGIPIGSVVDIAVAQGRLRVHLDQAVAPVWDEAGVEPVLGVSVPVDADTLVRRRYVHRIRLHSEGTHRQVRIGTEAFARGTEWFKLDECQMTERGLSTPAVERIVHARAARPVAAWPTGRTRKTPSAQARAELLLRQLADARRLESPVVVTRLCGDINALTGVDETTRAQLVAALAAAAHWLEDQNRLRAELFTRLQQAVAARDLGQVYELQVRAAATASHDRTVEESEIADAAGALLAAHAAERQQEYEAEQRAAEEARRAAERVRSLLWTLRRWGVGRRRAPREFRRATIEKLLRAADTADAVLGGRERAEVQRWREMASPNKPAGGMAPQPSVGQAPTGEEQPRMPLYKQVSRREWIKRGCPRCHVESGQGCVIVDGSEAGRARIVPHDERLRPILEEREERQPGRPWGVYEVACPACGQGVGTRCKTSRGAHRARHERAAEFTRAREPRSKESDTGAGPSSTTVY
ncbi:hypothetical protein [Streptomyces sp. NPDC093225]|uniref:hypothetical protein n=1 Tax=Streptomyces sp. NPDC093225 TaxID=3366034 RepID=UPI0038186680